MSLRELRRELVAAIRRHEHARDRDLILAWQIERVKLETQVRKRLPDLATLLAGKTRKQTIAQHQSQLTMLSEKLGIPLRKATTRVKPPKGV